MYCETMTYEQYKQFIKTPYFLSSKSDVNKHWDDLCSMFKRRFSCNKGLKATLKAIKDFAWATGNGMAYARKCKLQQKADVSESTIHRSVHVAVEELKCLKVYQVLENGKNKFNLYVFLPLFDTQDDTPGDTLPVEKVTPLEQSTKQDGTRDETTKIDPEIKSFEIKTDIPRELKHNNNEVVDTSITEIERDLKSHLRKTFSRPDVQRDIWLVTKTLMGDNLNRMKFLDALLSTYQAYQKGWIQTSIMSYFKGALVKQLNTVPDSASHPRQDASVPSWEALQEIGEQNERERILDKYASAFEGRRAAQAEKELRHQQNDTKVPF